MTKFSRQSRDPDKSGKAQNKSQYPNPPLSKSRYPNILISLFRRLGDWGIRIWSSGDWEIRLCVLIFVFLGGCQNQRLYKETQVLMGTFVEVTSPDRQAANIAFSEIKRIDDLMSKYKENSEVSRLNKLGRLSVSQDTLYVLKKSKEFWLLSNGAFDITVGPLMDLWGFTDKKYEVPIAEEIQEVLKRVGSDKIIFNHTNNVVEFEVPNMRIDLGAIAKGYAVDCAVNKLREQGIKSCLINAGGQIYALGDKPCPSFNPISYFKEGRGKFGKPWRIAIRNPRKNALWDYWELKNKAVSTSGDYEQYFTKGNKRYSHIINPKTGYPLNSGIISATVIANDGLTADALSTSIFVLGKEKGIDLAKNFPDVKVEIIEEKDVRDFK